MHMTLVESSTQAVQPATPVTQMHLLVTPTGIVLIVVPQACYTNIFHGTEKE